MKKIAQIAALAIFGAMAMTSCKKDYTCTCSTGGVVDGTFTFNDQKKKDAKKACDGWNTIWSIDGGKCELK